jgi:hypothetical protein
MGTETVKYLIKIKELETIYKKYGTKPEGWNHSMDRLCGKTLVAQKYGGTYTYTTCMKDNPEILTKRMGDMDWTWKPEWYDLVEEQYWTNFQGERTAYTKLEDKHLANIIEWTTKKIYPTSIIEGLKNEADRRGLTKDFLSKAPYPFKDKDGRDMICKDGKIQEVYPSKTETVAYRDTHEFSAKIASDHSDPFMDGYDGDDEDQDLNPDDEYYDKSPCMSDEEFERKFRNCKLRFEFKMLCIETRYRAGERITKAQINWYLDRRNIGHLMNEYRIWKERYERLDPGQKIEVWRDSFGTAFASKHAADHAELEQKIKHARESLDSIGKTTIGESMSVTQKGINKLNGLKVGEEKIVELSQAVSENKTITIDLISILKESKTVADLKLGEAALLKAVVIGLDTISLTISTGKVEKEVNSQVQAALAALVK